MMSWITFGCVLAIWLISTKEAHGVPIENRVVGQPEVRCGIESIAVLIHTEAPFKGRVYVEGESEVTGCFHSYADDGTLESGYDSRTAEFNIRFGECNMRRQRTLNPRGVAYSFTLIVSFHPVFLTGVDRAFHVRCFFMEAVKAVETAIDVNKLTTEMIDENFGLPQCTYHLKQGPEGPYLRFASVGDPVTHSWECDSVFGRVYGVLVHSCYVDDGHGNRFDLVNDRGCTTDRYLLDEIVYDANSISAHANTHVFKYADRVQLYFTCTVQLCFKDDGGCNGITPPQCGGPSSGTYGHSPDYHGPPDYHESDAPPPYRPPFPIKDHDGPERRPEWPDRPETFPGIGPFAGPPSEPTHSKEFFGPIDGLKYFGQKRFTPKKLDGQSHLKPLYKDSPLMSNDSISMKHENWTADDLEFLENRTRLIRDAKSGMETDLTVDLTVLPLDDEQNSTSVVRQALAQHTTLLQKKVCLNMSSIAIISFTCVLLIALAIIITALCAMRRDKALQRLKYRFCS